MEAPKTIYMPNELLTEDWTRHIEGQDTAYVRKDTLLEWLFEKRSQARDFAENTRNSVHLGMEEALNMVINEISKKA